MPKFGGKTFSPEDDFKVQEGDPWKAAPSGVGYNGTRDDEKGYARGLGAYASDDKDFRRPSQSRTDSEQPLDIWGKVSSHSGGAGPMLTGGGPVWPIGGDINPKRRYKSGHGGQSNGGL